MLCFCKYFCSNTQKNQILFRIVSRSQRQLDLCVLSVQFKFYQNRIISTQVIAVSRQDLFFKIDVFTQEAITFFRQFGQSRLFYNAKRCKTSKCSQKLEKIGQGVQELCPFEINSSKKKDIRWDFLDHSKSKKKFLVPISKIVLTFDQLVTQELLGNYSIGKWVKMDLKTQKMAQKMLPDLTILTLNFNSTQTTSSIATKFAVHLTYYKPLLHAK